MLVLLVAARAPQPARLTMLGQPPARHSTQILVFVFVCDNTLTSGGGGGREAALDVSRLTFTQIGDIETVRTV